VFSFKCEWYDVSHHGIGYKKDEYRIVSLDSWHTLMTNEAFVLGSHVEQVFYV